MIVREMQMYCEFLYVCVVEVFVCKCEVCFYCRSFVILVAPTLHCCLSNVKVVKMKGKIHDFDYFPNFTTSLAQDEKLLLVAVLDVDTFYI